jgi:intracellular septation protein
MLKYLLEAAFEGLSDEGWRKLSRNWGLFFWRWPPSTKCCAHTTSRSGLDRGEAVGVSCR